MFLVSAHTIYVYSSWKHCWSERQLPSSMEDKEVFLHVQDWWLYPVKTRSPTSEVQPPVHTKRTAFFFFKTHNIQSFLNSLPSQFSVLIPGRSVINMWQHRTLLPSLLSVCLQEAHTVAHTTELHVSDTLVVCLSSSQQTLLKGVFNESFLIHNGLEDKIRKGLFFYFPS